MIIQIREASGEQKPILERLMQLYLYDFSEIDGEDVNQNGLFDYKYLDSYWNEPGRFPFLIHVNDKIAGFVLVAEYSYLRMQGKCHCIAELFVVRKYRRQGIGKTAASQIFDRFPGRWEVGQITANVAAQGFWRSVIGEYTKGQFTEMALDNEFWQGPIQSFDNSR